MRHIKLSIIFLFLLVISGCNKDEIYGDIINTGLYIELVDEEGNNLFDSGIYDLNEFYIAYLKDGEYIRYNRINLAYPKGFQFIKGSNYGFGNAALKDGVTYMDLSLDITACGYPILQSFSESTLLKGIFRLEYKDKVFEPVDFVINIEQLEYNKHVNVAEVSGKDVLDKVQPEKTNNQFIIKLLTK